MNFKDSLKTTFKTLALGAALLAATHAAQAQAGTTAHTFVSGTGVSGPCSAAAPCATFSQALAQTAPGGTITALDAGDFGSATISHSVTIDGTGTLAAVSVPVNLGTVSGLTISGVATSDVVVLRGLSFSGAANALSQSSGITLSSPCTLLIDGCKFTQFSQAAINLAVSGGTVVVKKTAITNCAGAVGIQVGMSGATTMIALASVGGPPSSVLVSVKDSVIQGTASGIFAMSGMTDVGQSLVSQNTAAGLRAAPGATLSVSSCMIVGNGTAVTAPAGSVVRLTDNDIYNNTMALMAGGGVISTTGNNRRAGNSSATNPPTGGDAPTKGIVVQ